MNSASEIFQETMRQTLSGSKGAVNISDAILCLVQIKQTMLPICGKPVKPTPERLDSQCWEMCLQQEITGFIGHIFGEDGTKPSQDKLKTILDLSTQLSTSEVRSLLELLWRSSHTILCYIDA